MYSGKVLYLNEKASFVSCLYFKTFDQFKSHMNL